jgi:hypothetical protein
MFTIIRGDDVTIPVTFSDDAGQAINITGATVFFTVKSDLSDTDDDAVIAKTITTHSNASQGQTTITLTANDTLIDAGKYYWDLQIKDSAGKITSTLADTLEVKLDVTRRTA